MTDPIGKYYDDKRKEADRLHALIETRTEEGASEKELRGLRGQLEMARNAGE